MKGQAMKSKRIIPLILAAALFLSACNTGRQASSGTSSESASSSPAETPRQTEAPTSTGSDRWNHAGHRDVPRNDGACGNDGNTDGSSADNGTFGNDRKSDKAPEADDTPAVNRAAGACPLLVGQRKAG